MSTNKDKEDEDSSTKQILEYYQKYSQSKDLPKYFSGSVQYLPKIVDDDEEESIKTKIKSNTKITEFEIERKYDNIEEPDLELSPTGSVASNRKLEWDSLGDIGYIQRSSSLPILTQEKHSKNSKVHTSNNVKIVILPYTSSSEQASSGRNTLESSSSSSPFLEKDTPTKSATSEENHKLLTSDFESSGSDKKIVDFQQSLGYLKKKIGLPDAHSTPNNPQSLKDTGEKNSIQFNKKSVEQLIQADSNEKTLNNEIVNLKGEENKEIDIPLNPTKKVINLCLTKPLLLDCLSHTNVKKLTIGIQTDSFLNTVPRQTSDLITFYKHSDTLKVSSDSGKSSSSNAVASKCDSFEYVKNNSNNKESISNKVDNVPIDNIELTNKNENYNEEPLNLIKPKISPDVHLTENDIKTNDIERGIYVLQRLIKSKKYDPSTKKKYIKKILQKITDSKDLDDSSTSSDLFYPKADNIKLLQDHRKSSFKPHEEIKSPKQINIADNTDSDIPFIKERKAGSTKSEPKPSTSKPENVKSSSYILRKDKKKAATLSDNGIFKKSQVKEPEHKDTKKTMFTVTKGQENSSDQSTSSPQSYQNWKEKKTISEKVFESNGQAVGGGDQFLQIVNKEKEYQLNWINREIDHLGKLKCILEKTKNPCPSPKCIKKTSVYMVTSSNNKENKRNYVIETKLGSKPNSQQRNFRLNGENYSVKDPNCPCDSSKDSYPVVADIQVRSTDKTTNIKVTTFCNICKRAPCVCVTDFLQGISNPFRISDKAVKNHLDSKSKSCTCSCNSTTSSTTTSGKESSKTICIICHRSPCTCCSCKQIHNVKTCSVCKLYTCMCNISPKGSTPLEPYIGTFIPTSGPDSYSDKSKKNVCCKCEVCPCICGLSSNSSTSVKESPRTSSKTTTNSLTKVFVDCKCGPSRECRCNFVEKLLQHFNKEEVPKKSKEKKKVRLISDNVCTQSDIDKQLQTEDTNAQKKLDSFSQGDTDISSGSFKTDKSVDLIEFGLQKEGKSCVDACTNTNNVFTSQKETSIPKRLTNSDKKDQCVCTKEEKAVHPVNVCLTEDKCIGKTIEEGITQLTLKTVEKGTSSRVTTSEKSIECHCELTSSDKCIGTSNKKSSMDRSTSPRTCLVDIGTGCDPRGSLIDQATSPRYSQMDKGTTSERTAILVDEITSCAPLLLDKGSEDSARRTSMDEYTSCTSSRVDRGTEWTPNCLVDKCVSPVGFNVDKITECPRKMSKDQCTSIGCPQTDRGTQNIRKTTDNGTSPMVFTCDEDYADKFTDVADRETGTGTQKQSEIVRCKCIKTVCEETNIHNINKSTITSSQVFGSPNQFSVILKGDVSTKKRENNKCTETKTSVIVQTDLLSKDIRSPYPYTSIRSSSSLHKSKKTCTCLEKISKNKLICICTPLEKPKKIYKSKIICLDDACDKYRKCCVCRSKCRVDSRSSSPSDSRNKNKRFCQCSIKKNSAKRVTSPKIKSDSMDVSQTDDSIPENSSSNCTCYCCETSVPLERISLLRSDDREFPVCKECLDKRPILTTVCFADLEEDSSSYHPNYTKDYYRRRKNFCTCKRNSKAKDFVYCSHCKDQLKKTQQSRNGIAYTLTLEDEPPEKFKTRTKKKLKKLEEIKVKIPNPYNRKQRKNSENNQKRDKDRMKKIESGENSEDERLIHETSSKTESSGTVNNKKNNRNYTLQEYLRRNRPGFVNAAEFRRLALMNNKIERELNKDDLKIKFLEQNAHNNILKRERLFTEQEMREITRRNYKKLPEIQQKLIDKRVQKLRNADKFMADMLKKKIQDCVLKGKSSFPIDTNILNVYK